MADDVGLKLPLKCNNKNCLYQKKITNREGLIGFVPCIHEKRLYYELPMELSFETALLDDNFLLYANKVGMSEFVSPCPSNKKQKTVTSYINNQFFNRNNNLDFQNEDSCVQTYPPCVGTEPQDYAYCYGLNGNQPCQFTSIIDMEDFM